MALMAFISAASARNYTLSSPDGAIGVKVETEGAIRYSVELDGQQILAPSEISMTLSDGTVYGSGAVRKVRRSTVNRNIDALFYRKAVVKENYNEIELTFRLFKLVFRAYDNGVAYRFVSLSKKPFNVREEQVEYAFPDDWSAYVPYANAEGDLEAQLHNSFENRYSHHRLSEWNTGHLAFLPIMVEVPGGPKICISEADLLSYPGMFLINGEGGHSLEGYFPAYPTSKTTGSGDGRSLFVQSTADYIARCEPMCTFPWRLMGISRKDFEMTDNDLVYLLASPADPAEDYSWVKPGKVAWEWWNDCSLYGVDFEAGINNETYKYYIDFASANGIGYVIMDEGWSVGFEDLFTITPGIDLEELIEYGRQKNVGIILWAGYTPFQKDIEKACRVYSAMGIKGFKVDFMDSCDQQIVEFHRTAAQIAARYNLMLDFHGTYKPTGLSRTYPNVINYEGIYGLEQMKWASHTEQVTYDVMVPFIRFFAGSADYTQGAMRNASKGSFHPSWSEPMSQGTRCHQLAEYVVFSSPLNMLCDSPSNYMSEPECTRFIAEVPEVWDETIALDGKVGEYVAIARRSGDVWYVGVLGNWDERTVRLDLDFIGDGYSTMTIFRDGVNANKIARDYKKISAELPSDRKIDAHLAQGGGFVAIITKQ